MTYRCIEPQCSKNCSDCNCAISEDDDAAMLVVDLLNGLGVDGHGGPLEDGESALVDRARAWLAEQRLGGHGLQQQCDRLRELADSEGSRAVEYLRRARKAETDANRYRWLRKHRPFILREFGFSESQIEHWSNAQNEAKIDAAIDAAIAAAGRQD